MLRGFEVVGTLDRGSPQRPQENIQPKYTDALLAGTREVLQFTGKPSTKMLDLEDIISYISMGEDFAAIERLPQRSPEWLAARVFRFTASNFGAIAGHSPYKTPDRTLRDLVACAPFPSAAPMHYGTFHEDVARNVYIAERSLELSTRVVESLGRWNLGSVPPVSVEVRDRGLMVLENHPFLAASPDGEVFTRSPMWPPGFTEHGALEIKCPYGSEMYWEQKKYIGQVPEGEFGYPDGVPKFYYDQMQGQMNALGVGFCDFFVWSYDRSRTTRVPYDSNYFEGFLVPHLKQAYESKFLPGILETVRGIPDNIVSPQEN